MEKGIRFPGWETNMPSVSEADTISILPRFSAIQAFLKGESGQWLL